MGRTILLVAFVLASIQAGAAVIGSVQANSKAHAALVDQAVASATK